MTALMWVSMICCLLKTLKVFFLNKQHSNSHESRLTFVDIVYTVSPDKSTADGEIVLRNGPFNRNGKAISIADVSRC